jgi:UDP-3-O-[3-hydroxymyristoyl] N-acetylglucosamine deacetylase
VWQWNACVDVFLKASKFQNGPDPEAGSLAKKKVVGQAMMQTTLQDSIRVEGVGVHSGSRARLTLHPAEAGSGYTFLRTHLPDGNPCLIDARHTSVTATALCTVIRGERGASISTVEHVLAALSGLGIDNALIEVDSEEMPIMDGSSRVFVDAILQTGIRALPKARKVVKVLRKVSVSHGDAHAELSPSSEGLIFDVEIDFAHQSIGRQRRIFELSPQAFDQDIASARTFGFFSDAEKLRAAGFAKGASLDNTVVMDDRSVMNPSGLRFGDEFVRHKILDAVGDLALAGATLQGSYKAYCPGHRINFMMLDALFSDRANYAIVDAVTSRKTAGKVELAAALRAPDRN